MPSRFPPCCGISWNAYQICHHGSNHCYSRWMCSAWDGSNNALLRARQQKCCWRRPATQQTPAEHRGTYWKQDLIIEQLAYKNKAFVIVLQETHCRQASYSQLLTSWINPEQESRPCHVCPRVAGMVTGRSVSRTIRDWVVVRRRRRIQDRQGLQTSTLATHPNDHPDVPTHQSVRWRLQLPACQLGLQHNIPWRWEPGLLGNIQQPWTVIQPKGNGQFSLTVGTSARTQTWPSRVSARTADCRTDVS